MLPDAVANQIAAGEVIQRPASVVKELIENAIDAGANDITLVIKDSGRTLIQIIDNGKGMTAIDARVCFERHATSKIKSADELFSLETKGFRGEALASIAAIAQVELKTRTPDDDFGTKIQMEASKVKNEEPCQTPEGSSFSVKNLFYNVPARRNFLKSDSVEMKHIIDEFQRVAIPHNSIGFKLYHNGNELFNLNPSTPRQRVVAIFGNKFDERLVPVEEGTDIVQISGFVGKPEFAKRTRGEQYFFVNQRFIKSGYLNHAVTKAFEDLMPEGSFPFYTLFLEVDPKTIDVNIHPTKTEIKFQDERAIYAILRSSIRQALGKFNVAPSLDFEQEMSMPVSMPDVNKPLVPPTIKVNPDYNPFHSNPEKTHSGGGGSLVSKFGGNRTDSQSDWKSLYQITEEINHQETQTSVDAESEDKWSDAPVFQLHRKYIATQIRSGLLLVDQRRAHERILYEKFQEDLKNQSGSTQQSLFPETVTLNPIDHALVIGMMEDLRSLGFDLDNFGDNCLVVRGVPVEAQDFSAHQLLESFIENVKMSSDQTGLPGEEKIIRSMAKGAAIQAGKKLNEAEMRNLIDELFGCSEPNYSPDGKRVFHTWTLEDIEQKI